MRKTLPRFYHSIATLYVGATRTRGRGEQRYPNGYARNRTGAVLRAVRQVPARSIGLLLFLPEAAFFGLLSEAFVLASRLKCNCKTLARLT